MSRRLIATKIGKPTWTEREIKTPKAQIEAVWEMVEKYSGHPLLIDVTARIIEKARVPARDPKALARAVQLFSARKIKFFREWPERFASPLRTIVWGLGDCDDKSILVASMLRGFRMPIRLKRLALTLPNGERVAHIYPQALIDGEWVALESVREYPWGYDPENKARAKGLGVETLYVGDKSDTAYA